jgi:ubiquinone/menaquinone biosynthesis C-methylase UbiE/uncharacterized protein YbaR (Trm112 family)
MKMLEKLLDILICPICKSHNLKLKWANNQKTETGTGEILCVNCHQNYPVCHGIPCLLDKPQLEVQKEQIFQQWAEKEKKIERGVLDEDRITYKETYVSAAKEEINEDVERVLWEKLLYLHNQELKNILGNKLSSKWVVSKKNIQERNDHVFKIIGKWEGNFTWKRVLNVGSGVDDNVMKRLAAKGIEVINCDVILESLLELQTHNKGGLVCSNLKSLPFDEGTFDAVFCFHVIHHVEPIEQALSEAIRVLKPDGKVFIIELNYYHLSSLLGKMLPNKLKKYIRKEVRNRINLEKRLFRPSPYERVVQSDVVIGTMRKVGFTDIARKTATYAPIVFPDRIIKLWNELGVKLPAIFDPIAFEYLFAGRKSSATKYL